MKHTDPRLRHDFVYLFDVTDGNPNGDPDAGNLPRIDPETMQGLVSDVALKRKVRDYVARIFELLENKDLSEPLRNKIGEYGNLRGQSVFIQSKEALNTLIFRAFKEIGMEPATVLLDSDVLDVLPEELPEGFQLLEDGRTLAYSGQHASRRALTEELRGLFSEEDQKKLGRKITQLAGQVADAIKGTASDPREKEEQRKQAQNKLVADYYDVRMFGAVMSTGLNAGQVRGPMQITFARSIDPIVPMDLTITRQARTTVERMRTGTTEMGRKPIIPYGLYRAHGFFSPMLAAEVTEQDLALFWDALLNMFEHDRSASRGHMSCQGLYVFTHDNPLGNAHAHRLFQRVCAVRKQDIQSPRGFDDYVVEVNEAGMPLGVTLQSTWS